MILITGSKGKIGTAVTGFLRKKKIKFVQTARSKSYKKINNSYVKLDLLKENHIKKIFKDFKFQHIIHLAVTRNPFHIKKIRTYSTLEKDTLMMINLLKFCHTLKSFVYTSSAAVYQLPNVKDSVKRENIAKRIVNFVLKKKKDKFKVETISRIKRSNLKINPIFHQNSNKRLNGSNKLINELLLISFCFEKKISLYILRPFYVIETKSEKKKIIEKIKISRSK